MTNKKTKSGIGRHITKILSNRFTYHFFFWAIFFGALLIADLRENDDFLFVITNEVINVVFYAIIIYFNLFYLVPTFFSWDNKLPKYLFFLVLTVLVITPLKAMILYLKFYGMPDARAELLGSLSDLFIIHFLVAGFSTIFKIISDWARIQRERQELERRNMQSELKFLRSQINPHFLFNTLNNLYALTLKKSDKAPEIVIKLSEMMRYMLYECNEKTVPLIKEVNYLRNYLDLEELRQAKDIDINLKVNGMVTNQQIAPLMFIPFIENSFKHGLSNQISNGFVNIRLDVKPDKVHLIVENSKPETLPATRGKRSGGIGLVNVRRRLNLLYPNRHELVINNNPHTYQVDLKIDLYDS